MLLGALRNLRRLDLEDCGEGKPSQSLRLLSVQSTCCFPTVDVRKDGNERFTVVIESNAAW